MIECVYRIWAELGHQVELQFLDIDIEDDDNCLKDYIKVRVEKCKTTLHQGEGRELQNDYISR